MASAVGWAWEVVAQALHDQGLERAEPGCVRARWAALERGVEAGRSAPCARHGRRRRRSGRAPTASAAGPAASPARGGVGTMEAPVGEVVQDAVGRSGGGWRWRRHEGGGGQGRRRQADRLLAVRQQLVRPEPPALARDAVLGVGRRVDLLHHARMHPIHLRRQEGRIRHCFRCPWPRGEEEPARGFNGQARGP